MELFVADLIERFYTALWPFLRIGAMLVAVPILSIDAVTVRIRVFLTLLLTILVYPLVDWPVIDPVSATGLSEIFNQILIGLVMGFFLQIVTAAVVLAGQAISNSMGLAMATMVDPSMGNVPLVSQFMLIWYSNIPEEVTYFITRIEDYNLPFFGMLVLNFIFPLLVLMNSDYKRVNWFVVMAGIVILVGHYIDIYNMIMPATVGESWFIGIPEISAVLFFGGLFIFVVFSALTKAPLLAKRNPYIKESKHYHY